jgi:uncharacterized protein (DUF983 family)
MSTWKASKLYSILNLKCPRCHEGDLFPKGTLYHPAKFYEMHETCPCCGQVYEPEPGYYYGAMYVSFGFNTGLFLAVVFALSFLVEEITFTMVFSIILVVVIGLLPLTFRYSRSIWMNIFMHYEGPCREIRKL